MGTPGDGRYDVIVIGAGHNGLTAAALLAKGGRRVLVLERRGEVGGLAASVEFFRGYRTPGVLHDTSGVRHGLIRSLRLERYGLELCPDPPSIYAPQGEGPGLLLHHDPKRAAVEISRFSPRDAERYGAFRSFIRRVRGFVNGLLDAPPPEPFGRGANRLWPLVAGSLGRLRRSEMIELLRIGPMCAADWLDEWFEGDLLKALLAHPAVYGTFMGPRSPGSAANLLIWECRRGPLVKGGPPALIAALEAAARAAGVEIRTDARVDAIRVSDGATVGVSVNGGEVIDGPVVAATCDPKQTALELLPSGQITETAEERVNKYRSSGTAAKVHVALNAPADITGGRGDLVEMIRTGENLDQLEMAFDPVKYGRLPERPLLDIYVPRPTNPPAPGGGGVLSILVHFTPYRLKDRWSPRERERLGRSVIDTLEGLAPGIGAAVESLEVLAPPDLESRYALTGGHIYHGEHALDQLLVRPTPEFAGYRTPVRGLYLCGSGSHPGGGITCAPGALGARAILGGH